MAKKAKRRGRPIGSKNTKKTGKRTKIGKSFAKMEVAQLRMYIDNLEGVLAGEG